MTVSYSLVAPERYPGAIHFFVPGKPITDNERTKHAKSGHSYVTKEAVDWQKTIADYTGIHAVRILALGLPLAVTIVAIGGRSDAPNLAKCICDGMKLGLGIDDFHFNPVHQYRELKGKGERGVWIHLEPSLYQWKEHLFDADYPPARSAAAKPRAPRALPAER